MSKKIIQIILIVIIFGTSFFIYDNYVFAQTTNLNNVDVDQSLSNRDIDQNFSTSKDPVFKNPIGATSIYALANTVVSVIVKLGYVFVVGAIIYSGFLFVIAQGNDEKLKTARKTFFFTIIGAFILLGAQLIGEVLCQTAMSIDSSIKGCLLK
jgi:hypothetical protein